MIGEQAIHVMADTCFEVCAAAASGGPVLLEGADETVALSVPGVTFLVGTATQGVPGTVHVTTRCVGSLLECFPLLSLLHGAEATRSSAYLARTPAVAWYGSQTRQLAHPAAVCRSRGS